MENEVKQLELDILEHVAKILDQREVNCFL